MTEERNETTPGPAAEPTDTTPTDTLRAEESSPAAPVETPETPSEADSGTGTDSSEDEPDERERVPAGEPRPETGSNPMDEALPLVEALLFASHKPVPLDKLAEAAELPEEAVAAAVDALEAACAADGRGVKLDRVAGGVRLVTRPEYDYPVRRLLGLDGKTKLSMAALETLAIVSYRQPVTGPEIAEFRSVNSSSSIRTLLDRKLITTAGRKEVVGTPFLYKTTKEFLVHFGLKSLGDLPKPEELEAIYGLEAPKSDPSQTELFRVDEATGEVETYSDAELDAALAPAGRPAGADEDDADIPAGTPAPEAPPADAGEVSTSSEEKEERHDG